MTEPHETETVTDNPYWEKRWEVGSIGWHKEEKDARAEALNHFKNNATNFSGKIFVPLCGASLDMIWLAEQGLEVVGLDCAQLAIDTFFEKYYKKEDYKQEGNVFSAGNIKIIKGDLYDCPELRQEAPFDLVYDRASLVAINWEDRDKYVDLMLNLLPDKTQNLCYFLQGMDYEKGKHPGPPHIFTQANWHRF